MKLLNDIDDDQIRIIGLSENDDEKKNPEPRNWWIIISIVGVVLVGVVIFIITLQSANKPSVQTKASDTSISKQEPALFEPAKEPEYTKREFLGKKVDSLTSGFTEIKDTIINDIPIRIFIPHNADLSLYVGKMNRADTCVIYAAQAADIRADNGDIIGAFVLDGKPLAWGLSKKGYCASINGKVTIGVAENSPLFEQATEEGGYFFRQYPLVKDGKIVENEPKGKSIRRAICDRIGEIFMVETGTKESFHDFAQALVDLGVDQAIYLVGSSAYGWAVDENGTTHEFGNDAYYTKNIRMPQNISYIVWKRK